MVAARTTPQVPPRHPHPPPAKPRRRKNFLASERKRTSEERSNIEANHVRTTACTLCYYTNHCLRSLLPHHNMVVVLLCTVKLGHESFQLSVPDHCCSNF